MIAAISVRALLTAIRRTYSGHSRRDSRRLPYAWGQKPRWLNCSRVTSAASSGVQEIVLGLT
jgi:hypothetical protein